MLSFIIPAHDEEASIGAVVRAIADAATEAGLAHEIVVAADTCSDRTAELAAAAGACAIVVAYRQIAATRDAGARAALGDPFVFVDADTLIGADVVRGLAAAMAAGAVGGGAAVRSDEPTPRWVRWTLPLFTWLARRMRFTGGCFPVRRARRFRGRGRLRRNLVRGRGAAPVQAPARARRLRDLARSSAHVGPQAAQPFRPRADRRRASHRLGRRGRRAGPDAPGPLVRAAPGGRLGPVLRGES
jgi:glycosyltransferase involved in cell wall biosynthesis